MRSRTITVVIGGAVILAASVGLVRGAVELAVAARLAPDIAQYGVVHALALDAAGRRDEADAELTTVVERHPFDREALSLLVRYRLERHDSDGALTYARRLAALQPGNADMQRLVQRLVSHGNH
jgi:Flp pilus assembly protein TadD